jgi:hypothetical protein
MRIRKVDRNQKGMVRGLRALGYSVRHTHIIGKGFPDIAIGKHGRTVLVEIKMEGESLTPDECTFFDEWNGAAIIGVTVEQVHAEFMAML